MKRGKDYITGADDRTSRQLLIIEEKHLKKKKNKAESRLMELTGNK